MKRKMLVSSCLRVLKVRSTGSEKARLNAALARLEDEQPLIVHVPELAAGLPTPRPPAEIIAANGEAVLEGRARVYEKSGNDATAHYQLAAWLALRAAQEAGCDVALLTDGSPTCGSRFIYDGTFSGQRHPGMGVAATLLRQHGITVFSEQQLSEFCAWIEEKDKHEDSV